MEALLLAGAIYLLYGVPAFVGGLFFWLFLRKHIQLRMADWSLLIAPFAVWLGATAIYDGDKSLSNIVEALVLGCIAALLFGVRAGISVRHPQTQPRLAVAALAGGCFAAIAFWALVPGLPE